MMCPKPKEDNYSPYYNPKWCPYGTDYRGDCRIPGTQETALP
jgi:hypothetical protein